MRILSLFLHIMRKHLLFYLLPIALGIALGFVGRTLYVRGHVDYPAHYKSIVKELSSERYQGRGYAADGVREAGGYIAFEFGESGVDEVSMQPFSIDINTFPGRMAASVDGRELVPGRDFVMREYSPGVKGEFNLYQIDTANYDSEAIFADLAKPENKGVFVVCDFWFTYKHAADFRRMQSAGCPNGGLLYTWNEPLKFYKAYGEKVVDKPIVWTTAEVVDGASRISLDVENKFLKDYETDNIIALVRGARHDSCFVFTAHYDHLGNLGADVFYPGANDNASGTAAIITLAEYYAHHRPEFDMWFVAFSGEDANLRGSTWFVEHPSVPLDQIKYLFNIDMIGDNNPVQYCELSDAGLPAFPLWERLNAELGCFQALRRGELAANSDHYPFAVRGVPCVFFENEQGDAFKYYHTAEDSWENAIFDSYEPIFKLITGFVTAVTGR